MNDASRTARPQEARVMFRLFRLTLNLSGKLQKELAGFTGGILELYKTASNPSSQVEITFPDEMVNLRRKLVDGRLSAKELFPVQEVVEIHKHACVGLKETIRHAAGHGAKFNFAWDPRNDKGNRRNREGLNGTQAVTDLLDDVKKAMVNSGIPKESRDKTPVG